MTSNTPERSGRKEKVYVSTINEIRRNDFYDCPFFIYRTLN